MSLVDKNRETDWVKVLYYIHINVPAFYGLYLVFTEAQWLTVAFALLTICVQTLGITIGAHRYWAHQAFAATGPVRLFLMLAHTMTGTGRIYDWVLYHRIHHKFYGTDNDPYDHNKGFLYSHLYSNVLGDHPDKERLERDIDMRDVDTDRIVWFQRRFYLVLFPILGLLLPINAPFEYWGESIKCSVFILGFLRLAVAIHTSWLVNSAMHVWGMKPGDKFPADDNTIFIVEKSYWPNYHYLLPWDCKCGEFGQYDSDFSTIVLKLLAVIDGVSLLKVASEDAIRQALYDSTNRKRPITECLEEVHQTAIDEAYKENMRYRH